MVETTVRPASEVAPLNGHAPDTAGSIRPDTITTQAKVFITSYERVFDDDTTETAPPATVVANSFNDACQAIDSYEEGRIVGGRRVSTVNILGVSPTNLPPAIVSEYA